MMRTRAGYGLDIKQAEADARRREILASIAVPVLIGLALTALLIQVTFPGGLSKFLGFLGHRAYWHFRFAIMEAKGMTEPEFKRFVSWWQEWKEARSFGPWYGSVFGVVTALGVTFSIVRLRRLGDLAKDGLKIRESEHSLVSAKELTRLISKAVSSKKRPHTFRPSDVILGREKIRIPGETIGLHLGLAGASQTGKTNVINQILSTRREAKEKVLIVDPNGEFFSRFGRPKDVLLSLYDTRAAKWDFWSEGLPSGELAKALVEVKDGMDANTKFFQSTGRSVLASLLKISKDQRQLWQYANLADDELGVLLKDHNELSHRYLGQSGSNQAGGVIATALMNLNFLRFLNHHAHERELKLGAKETPFSVRNWVLDDNDDRWVFLAATDSHWEDTRPLIRLWFDIASNALLERKVTQEQPTVWLICDEVSTVGNLPTLPKILDRGYKYKGRLILGFQSKAQIEVIYGREQARNVDQGLQNVAVFACNEEELAKDFAARLGSYEVEELEASRSLGDKKDSARVSISARTKRRFSVTPDEIKSLPENEGYLKLARFPATKVTFEYLKLEKRLSASTESSRIPEVSWVDDVTLESYKSPKKDNATEDKKDHRTAADEETRSDSQPPKAANLSKKSRWR